MTGLYDTDILEWSEHHARLLRQLALGHPDEVPDWENIIEEVESVGRDRFRAVRSALVQALLSDLKCAAWPQADAVPQWAADGRVFRGDAADECTAFMRMRIDLADLYRRALSRMPDSFDGQPPLPVPDACPVTLDELLRLP